MNPQDEKLKQMVKEETLKVVKQYLKTSAFTDRKLTDMPTDSLQVVPRKYVTLNGLLADRPASSVATIGQPYLATDTGVPMTFSVEGWRNGVGSVVAGA